MAGIDYGVIAFKNGKLTEEKDGCYECYNGMGGEFNHYFTGITFYRTSIKNNEDIEKATIVLDMYEEFNRLGKKVNYFEIGGLKIKTKELYNQTFLSKFKDEKGDFYTIIHGYDVSFNDFWCKKRSRIIKKIIKKERGI